jgi:hypothetical protein
VAQLQLGVRARAQVVGNEIMAEGGHSEIKVGSVTK